MKYKKHRNCVGGNCRNIDLAGDFNHQRKNQKPLTPISEVVADEIQQSTESVSVEVS